MSFLPHRLTQAANRHVQQAPDHKPFPTFPRGRGATLKDSPSSSLGILRYSTVSAGETRYRPFREANDDMAAEKAVRRRKGVAAVAAATLGKRGAA